MKKTDLFEVGDKVKFIMYRDTHYEHEMTGVITQIIPYGFLAYYVIEYYAIIDFALTMVHHNLVEKYASE